MGPAVIAAVVVGALALILVLVVAWLYNGLVASRNQTKNAWAQIDVQLHRRHDLVPNLVEIARGYAAHERQTLEGVIQARNLAASAGSISEKIKAEGELSGMLARLMVVCEQYPELKANQNFLALQEELTSTENKIAFSRQAYNDSVMEYNTRREAFPSNLVAGAFAFKEATSFEVSSAAVREAPRVKF